jgi:ABC-type phosphate transport system substrate-binding protein
MNKHTLFTWLKIALAVVLLGGSVSARGELVVIVHPQSGVNQLTRPQVINIFLGNRREFPNGLRAQPFDLPNYKNTFYLSLVNKDTNQMTAYWSRLVFAGNTSPPLQATDTQKLIETVASNRGAIAYVERESVKESKQVQIVFSLPDK